MKLLLVEDEPLISMDLEDALESLGVTVVGPAASVAQALTLVEQGGFSAALLDVSLRGERVDAVADALSAMSVPFVFITGYRSEGIPRRHRDRPVLGKPFLKHQLREALTRHLVMSR